MPPVDQSAAVPAAAHVGGLDVGSVSTFTPDLGTAGTVVPGHIVSPDVSQAVTSGVSAPDVSSALGSAPAVPDISAAAAAVPTPDVMGSIPPGLLDQIQVGQPIAEQAQRLAGGINETYGNILQRVFETYGNNFLTTASEMVKNPASFTPEQAAVAQQQLEAIAKLQSDPTLATGSQDWLELMGKAMHYWRPM